MALVWAVVGVACGSVEEAGDSGQSERETDAPARDASTGRGAASSDGAAEAIADPVWLYEKGEPRKVSAGWARKRGYTIIELGDEWAPYIFSERSDGDTTRKPNPYRKIYIGLANDRTNNWGKPLEPGRHNYLELYGIPPTLTVLKKRVLREHEKECFETVDTSLFQDDLPYALRYHGRKGEERFERRYKGRRRHVRKLMAKLNLDSLDDLAKRSKHRWLVEAYRRDKRLYHLLVEAQKRLVCEGMLDERHHDPGELDWHTHVALKRFERKHMIFGWGFIWKETREALGRTPLENGHRALVRMLRERIATTVPVLEDGTVKKWKDEQGRVHEVRNLVAELTESAKKSLGWETPQKMLDFFENPPQPSFESFRVAVKLPSLPGYYEEQMKLSVRIYRGDVWYEFPYDEKGNEKPQPRSLKPRLVVYVHHQGNRIPLVEWRTTIGGWRSEMRDGHEYWRYKNSDTGRWLWKYVVAAPVWFPPPGTPPRDLVKRVKRNGRWRTVVKREEMGPGYRSAYGLVAALHTQERRRGSVVEDIDHGIRTHGSVAYMSIRRSHSHGCHRLYNHLAVRLHSFLLQRHAHERMGQVDKRWTLPFTYDDKRYVVDLDTKGYFYRYVPPIPVMVTRGRIRGSVKEPIRRFMKKAGIDYPEPDGSVDGGGAAPDGATATGHDGTIAEPDAGTTQQPPSAETGGE